MTVRKDFPDKPVLRPARLAKETRAQQVEDERRRTYDRGFRDGALVVALLLLSLVAGGLYFISTRVPSAA